MATGRGPTSAAIGAATAIGASLKTAATGAAGAAAAKAPLIANPIGLAIGAGLLLYSVLARPSARDRSTPGAGLDLRANPADPTSPIDIPYGRPIFVPKILLRHQRLKGLNQRQASESVKLVTVLSLGAGPLSGAELDLWRDDVRTSETVDADSPGSFKTLAPLDADRKRWAFPKTNVIRDTVVIFQDGVATSTTGGLNGAFLFEDVAEQITDEPAAPRIFGPDGVTVDGINVEKDPEAATDRFGFFLPSDGILDKPTLEIELRMKSFALFRFGGVPSPRLVFGKRLGGKQYVWIDFSLLASNATDKLALFRNIEEFRATYRVQRELRFEKEPDGQSVVVFPESVPAGVDVTATFQTDNVGDKLKVTFRPGDADQDPLPLEDARNSFVLEGELLQAAPVEYETVNEVDDLEVVLASGAEGVSDTKPSGSGAGTVRTALRDFRILIREVDAPDVLTAGTDLSAGWVTLKDPVSNTDTFRVQDRKTGKAVWGYALASLYRFTTGEDPEARLTHSLPRRRYAVRVVALDKPNATRAGEVVNHIRSRLFLDSVTEIVKDRLVLPMHATLTVEDEVDQSGAEPTYAVAVAARKVWQPDADAVYDEETGRPEPGVFGWTRNPVWCDLDYCLDPFFGSGRFYSWRDNIRLARSLAAASFCDELVDRGGNDTTQETRSELDFVIRDRKVLMGQRVRLHAGSGVLPLATGGILTHVIDQDGSPAGSIEEANVEDGTFGMRRTSREEQPDILIGVYPDERIDQELNDEPFAAQERSPEAPVVRRIDLHGVRRISQVLRVLSRLADQFVEETDTYEVRCATLEFLKYEAGDILELTSSSLAVTKQKCRVVSVSWGSNLRSALVLQAMSSAVGTGTAPEVPTGALELQSAPQPLVFPELALRRVG